MKTLALSLAALGAVLLSCAPQVAGARTGVTCRLVSNPLQMAVRQCACEPCHLCELSVGSGGCGLIKTKDMSLSDGSDVPLEQPLLKADDWFLSQDALTKSRGGVARTDLAAFSAGNRVKTFVATKEFFDSAFDDLENTRTGDRILLSGWTVDNVPFKPETDPIGATSSLQVVVGRAVERGVSFHALVWANMFNREANMRVRDFVNKLPRNASNSGKAEFVFDDRLGAALGTHHQKVLVIQRGSGEIAAAYVGGVDITGDRWDTIKHDQAELRKKAKIRGEYDGWLDAHVRIEGSAAKDVAATFVARWNSKTKPGTDNIDDFKNPPYSTLPAPLVARAESETTAAMMDEDSDEDSDSDSDEEGAAFADWDEDSESEDSGDDDLEGAEAEFGDDWDIEDSESGESKDDDMAVVERGAPGASSSGAHSVQIVRTFSCKYKNYEFAPKGETSILQARIKAIRNAKNYIYIEDQYFVLVPELLDELLKVLPQLQRVIVVVPRPERNAKLAGYEKYMLDMVSPVQKLYPNKFQFYTTKKARNLYIHTKLVIIDDVYLSVGSANWNRRSMTSDSEIAANIVDSESVAGPEGVKVTKLARDFRIRKFSELTGQSSESLQQLKFLDAANLLDGAFKDPAAVIEPFAVDQKFYFTAFSDDVREALEPHDIC
ncbi:hypothetical protein PybrP1_007498 [[Pythium] brassicae (nom. inval.)]|nr:hypothetical protein PybrP1_007498 [[Pythium] brassicae (nom. inval.)]